MTMSGDGQKSSMRRFSLVGTKIAIGPSWDKLWSVKE